MLLRIVVIENLVGLYYRLTLAQTSGSKLQTCLSSVTHKAEKIIKKADTVEKHLTPLSGQRNEQTGSN